MRIVVDVGVVRTNLKNRIGHSIFSWIDVRNNFYNYGLNLLEDVLKINNIGIFTNSLNDAIKIRNVNRKVPIILTNINNLDQVYDVIINNITLVIKDYNQLEEISNLNLQDKISIVLQISINNYEDGIKYKHFHKAIDFIKNNKCFNRLGVFTIVNDEKYNETEIFKKVIVGESGHTFSVGGEIDFMSDSFISKEVFNEAVKYELNVDKCFKLVKGDIFINKKIKKDCYGIRIKADNLDLDNIQYITIDNVKYRTTKANYNTLFMIGKDSVKAGRKVDITNLIPNNCYTNWPNVYVLNGKIINLNLFS